jgi:glycine cleavage system H protein
VVPNDLRYALDLHVWVRRDGDEVVLGMTDIAQTMSGRVVAVTWKRVGRMVKRGDTIAVVESAKWVGPFPAALSGELTAVNSAGFADDTALANRDPYGTGWMARIRPDDWETEANLLADGTSAFAFYREFIDRNELHCYRCGD